MRNRIIACLLSLTLVFNSFAPTLAFAVGVGGQDLEEQVESELVEEEVELEEETLDDGFDTGASTYSDSQLSLLDTGVSGGEEPEVESSGESAVYSPRAVPAIVKWLIDVGVSNVLAYAIPELIFNSDADPLLATNVGILKALILDDGYSAIHYIYAYSRDSYEVLTHVNQLLRKIGADVDEVEKFLSYNPNPNGSRLGVAEWTYYLVKNSEIEYEGSTLSLAEMLFGVASKATFEDSNGTYGYAELLYYLTMNSEYKEDDVKFSIADLLYKLVRLSSYESPNEGHDYGIAEALFYIMENSDSEKSLLEGIRSRLQYTTSSGTVNFLGSMVYWIYQNSGDIETLLGNLRSDLRFTGSSGTVYNPGTLIGYIWQNLRYSSDSGTVYSAADLLYYIYKNSGDIETLLDSLLQNNEDVESSIRSILTALRYTTSSGTTYNPGTLLYYTWQNLRYTTDSGVNYTASELLYYVWQCLRIYDNSEFLHTTGSLLYSINQKFDGLQDSLDDVVRALEGLAFREDLESSSTLWATLFGALEFALIASSIDDLTDTLETTFPFSLVAGFVAIIGLLQAEPVAPCFDFPLPDGSGGTYVYTVDLSPFDPVAEVFRVLITIVFCLGLISITRNFIFKGGSSE